MIKFSGRTWKITIGNKEFGNRKSRNYMMLPLEVKTSKFGSQAF